MKLSIIIPTYNEEKYIKNCIKSIRNCEFSDYEIIVVDGRSTDDTVKIAKKYADRVVKEEGELSITNARNMGARIAKGEYVAFLDADSIVCNGWVDIVQKNLGKGVLALGGPVYYGKFIYDIYSFLFFKMNSAIRRFFNFVFLSANNCVYKRDFFLKIGGFDNVVCEEQMMGRKIGKYKKNIVFINSLKVRLSYRRFEKYGFLRTLLNWFVANLSLVMGKGVPITSYKKCVDYETYEHRGMDKHME